ncbi:hypothetical protein COO60DRAFT_451662 [Scenedesmus sp. NREL 46B-D3]|nr:hypothetical protein COO60DRAFT_451662 [Scenedesmus sp. NREL 46B-D3]
MRCRQPMPRWMLHFAHWRLPRPAVRAGAPASNVLVRPCMHSVGAAARAAVRGSRSVPGAGLTGSVSLESCQHATRTTVSLRPALRCKSIPGKRRDGGRCAARSTRVDPRPWPDSVPCIVRHPTSSAVVVLSRPRCRMSTQHRVVAALGPCLQEGRSGNGGPAGGFGPGFGSSSEDTPPARRGFNAADRHPSMHIAAQIASATQLTMVPAAASVGPAAGGGSAGSGLPSILEVDASGTAAGDDGSMSAFANGGAHSVTSVKVEGD